MSADINPSPASRNQSYTFVLSLVAVSSIMVIALVWAGGPWALAFLPAILKGAAELVRATLDPRGPRPRPDDSNAGDLS